MVGAGINGAVAAAALAGKGAKVTVIDKADFGSFTSQESSNLAWGGIKYLENYEFGLVWGLCKSRNHLMKSYPSQVREIRFYTSIAKGFRKPRILIYLGALLYWFMGRFQTKPPRLLSVSTIRKEAPMIDGAALAGGLEYSDCYFVENDTRFAFGFIRKVLQTGGCAINYMELVSADFHDGLWHCSLRDHVTGQAHRLMAKTLVNAAGPFADKINAMLRIDCPFKHIFSKGAHIIVPQFSKTERVLTFFASDGRLFFMIPMGERTCIGTTDTRVDNEVAEPSADDVEFLLANANALLNLEKPLARKDVIAQRCGVRPLVVKKTADVGNAEWTALSRKHEIDIQPSKKMCSIYGGKLTDCINVGEEISGIVESFGVPLVQSLKPWYGEPSAQNKKRFEAVGTKLGLDEAQRARLWRRYGKDAFKCLEKIRNDASMANIVIEQYTRAELHHMAEYELVVRLEDFLRRRSRLALTQHPATLRCDPGMPEAARILFGQHADAELARYFSSDEAVAP
ncbi:Aerobic glycerol-3-phosphate dehydrogenase [Pontiella sulfatireligans]|uniref:Aerobic glycerol-3-phosphate dehydrogenase n=1 Tax=Pontiella sulfatireligans TaxID=2750658 RepID=A0A6C2URA7_9BACT|nr:Aerobic glycerol-3-phosphate dehydrogenase [Pontiella sulfatireligans]